MRKRIVISFLIVLLILVFSIVSYLVISKKKHDQYFTLIKYKSVAQKIVYDSWNHYKNNVNNTGDWWGEKFKHPCMIQPDGRPLAFPDGSDADDDGVAGIDWGNPDKPFEYVTASETSSYVLLRAVWMRDKKVFDKVWKWTHDNLQRSNVKLVYFWKDRGSKENGWKTPEELHLDRDNLFSWRWIPTVATYNGVSRDGIIRYSWQPPTPGHNPNDPWRDGWDVATDADTDIALALIFADSLWGSKKDNSYLDYADHATAILNDLWEKTTLEAGGMRYLAGGNNIKSVEPGYLSPFSYRIFNDFDSKHDWNQLVDSSYRIFKDAPRFPMNPITDKTGNIHSNDPRTKNPAPNLPPDWINVDQDGTLKDGDPRNEPEFGTDTFRMHWRIAVDYLWNKEAAEKNAKDVLFSSGSSSAIKFFKWRMKNPPKKLPDKEYDLTGKLSSVFWHNGEPAFFETNYEPPADIPNRDSQSNCFRANCANYGVYLSYAYAAGEYDLAQKFLMPLITPEADGFSHRQYIIPEDQIKNETPEHIKKNTPVAKRDTTHDKAFPYHDGDGWWIKSKWGGYWTQWDHSDWNSQNEYYNNMWAWFGLATYAGVIQNLYKYQEREPKSIDYIKIYDSDDLKKELTASINSEYVYVVIKGKDANRRHKDYIMLKVSSDDPIRKSTPILIKLAETDRSSGVYIGRLKIAMNSNNALAQIGASRGSSISFEVDGAKHYTEVRKVGTISLSTIVDDFSNGSIDDANPTSWWTDAYFPESQSDVSKASKKDGYYIWHDSSGLWHLAMKSVLGQLAFQGQLYSDGNFTQIVKSGFAGSDSILDNNKNLTFSVLSTGGVKYLSFKTNGTYIKFDVKKDGLYDQDHVFVGAALSTAYAVPFVLKTQGSTGTYTLTPTTENVTERAKYSLKIDKIYSGKDYPYLGSVIFDKSVKDWTNKDELVLRFYLKEDIGNIRVDIQDQAGVTAILNGYNPWDPQKGPGWYTWRSNTPFGTEVNRDNVDPRPIKNRRWWKGWSFADGRTMPVIKLDLKNIFNVQMCLGPAENKDTQSFLGPVTLETTNYYVGNSDPKNVKSITIYKDSTYKTPYLAGEPIKQNKVYVQVIGKDGNAFTADTIYINVDTTDNHPKARGIKLALEETDVNSGVYKGELGLSIKSNEKLGIVGSGRDSVIKFSSHVNKFKTTELTVGEFMLETVIEDFETTISNQFPSSWWTDDLDPLRGRPEYASGRKLGYFMWQTADGIWHLNWSGDMKPHVFEGRIVASEKIEILNRINFEKNDVASVEKGKIINFKGFETFGDDGIEFRATGEDIKYDLRIDGIPMGTKVQIGKFEYKKAYSMPFILKNKGITSTYKIVVTNNKAFDGQNSMFISKQYNKKEYPYFGKWGLDGEKADFSFQDSLKFMVYLPRDIGNVRVDIEDVSGNSAIMNEYNPWDGSKGPGWYVWDSNFSAGIGVSDKKIQPLPIKDRTWFKGWDMLKQQNRDVTRRINLEHIINLLISVGGGDKKDLNLNIDSIKLYRANYHMGSTPPKKISAFNLYTDPSYEKEKIKPGQRISKKIIYVEIVGVDGNPFERDRFFVDIMTSDRYKTCSPIKLRVYETGTNSGIYRGKFIIDLSSDEALEIIGAASGKKLTVKSPVSADSFSFEVGDMQNSYVIDDFDDGSISDKTPVSWWIDTIDPVAKKVLLDPIYDKGIYIYKDIEGTWHLDWNPEIIGQDFTGYMKVDNKLKLLDKRDFNGAVDYQDDKREISIHFKAKDLTVKHLTFSVEGNDLEFDFKVNGIGAKEKVFIGQDKKNPYILPIKLSNVPVVNNYDLSVVGTPIKGGFAAMNVQKNYTGVAYPYFGCWGLSGDVANFTDKDSVTFWVYLYDDPGNIRVDIQDDKGTTAVLNGYNPYDYVKGPGWYQWTSSYKGGLDVDEGRAQSLPIKDRQWWQGWDSKEKQYVDISDKLDLKKIINIQFSVGGGDKRNIKFVMDGLSVDKPNYHFGQTPPAKINGIVFYRNKDFTEPYTHSDEVKQDKVYFKITGIDGNPESLDKFRVKMLSDDPRSDASPITVFAQETGTSSGVYTGQFNIGIKSANRASILGVEKGRLISLDYGSGKTAGLKVGEIVKQFIIDDFSDGKVSDKNPVTWWVDTVDPFSDVAIASANSKPGYYVWRDKAQWHLRWKSAPTGNEFEGSILANGKITAAKYINMDMFDKAHKTTNSIIFSSKTKSKLSGIDFTADSDNIDFDIKKNGQYIGREVWIGSRAALAYSVPFRLDNNKISSTYTLSVMKSTKKLNGFMMKVDKRYNGKAYPYFGSWGLRGDVSNWSEMDEFHVWMYLPSDPGNIKVELEDVSGNKGILNGYAPYDAKRGPGWYKWSSNQFNSDEAKSDNIQPLPIKNRQWWKAWSDNDQAFVDTTELFDPKNVKNVQFILGGGGTKNAIIYIDSLELDKSNYIVGDTYPYVIQSINLYKDNKYLTRYSQKEKIADTDLYIEVIGQEVNKEAVDIIEVAAMIRGSEHKTKNVRLTETSPDSGVYRGVLSLTIDPIQKSKFLVKKGDVLVIKTLGCDIKQTEIKVDSLESNYISEKILIWMVVISALFLSLLLILYLKKSSRHAKKLNL